MKKWQTGRERIDFYNKNAKEEMIDERAIEGEKSDKVRQKIRKKSMFVSWFE